MSDDARMRGFLLRYALANAGGVVAYTPLLALLLPAKLSAVAGAYRVEWLSLATLLGALSASAAAIGFGWLSDLVGSRRWWVAAGTAATAASYLPVLHAATPAGVVAAIVLFQACVNLLLAPLAAWAADVVPDERKGMLGGMIGAGPPAGALAGVIATLPAVPSGPAQYAVVAAALAPLLLPLLVARSAPRMQPGNGIADVVRPAVARRDLVLLWIARLLVQTAAVVLFAFLLFYFEALHDAPPARWVARLSAAAMALGFPLALFAGRWSDRAGPRRPFLAGAAAAMALGLGLMAAADARPAATAGYLLFAGGLSVFLPLQATFAMQLLPHPARRGRDLGLLNLANTIPAVIATVLAAGLVPRWGYPGLLGVLAGAAAVAGGCIALVRCDRQAA